MTASKADQVIRLGASIAGSDMDGRPLRVPCSNTTHDFVSTNGQAIPLRDMPMSRSRRPYAEQQEVLNGRTA